MMPLVNPAKASPEDLMNAAKNCIERRNYEEAEPFLLEVLNRDMDNHEAYDLMAHVRTMQRNFREAVLFCMNAIKTDPTSAPYRQRFIDIAGRVPPTGFNRTMDEIIVECLKDPDRIDCSRMQALWLNHMLQEPGFKAQFGFDDAASGGAFDNVTDFSPLFTERFLLGIKAMIVNNSKFEKLICRLRRYVLDDRDSALRRFTPEQALVLAEALGHYAFQTDYILNVSKEEKPRVEALRAEVESDPKDAAAVALLAAYVPLCALKNAEEIEKKHGGNLLLADLIRLQITHPRVLRETAETIETITPISSGTSEKVREQYEEFPYPRWRAFSRETLLREWPLSGNNMKVEGHLLGRKVKILNAGCGTGREAASMAIAHAQSDVLAVDLSRASIAYGMLKAREMGITNIRFRQGDILKLGALDERFDLIASGGVLHHLKDPTEGWRVLAGLLNEGGIMRLGLYSKHARKEVMEVQAIAREKGYGGDKESMKTFRKIGANALDPHVLRRITRFADYYHMAMYRDLLFHVQEHDYDIPELGSVMDELGLEFLGFFTHRDITNLYLKEFPDDPEGTNLKNWDAFERKYPETFTNMYQFWCRKKKA